MPRVLAQITIQLLQPEDGSAQPHVAVSHPPDDQTCGLMMWNASKLIGENFRKLHEEQRVRIERSMPNGGGWLAG